MAGIISATVNRILAFRLKRHGLTESLPDPASASVQVAGAQAQSVTAGKLSLQLRSDRGLAATIEDQMWDTRNLVRTWCLRGTAHLIAAADLLLMTSAVGPCVARHTGAWLERHRGLTPLLLKQLTNRMLDALADGPQTRREIAAAVAGDVKESDVLDSWGGFIRYAALQGLVCFGPPRGAESTFVRTDEWIGIEPVAMMDHDQAISELFLRYLTANGPATIQDFAYWSGIRITQAKKAIDLDSGEFIEVQGYGYIYGEDGAELESSRPGGITEHVVLLPQFDTYLLGHRDKSLYLDKSHYNKVFLSAARVCAVVLYRGRVSGIWSYKRRGRKLDVKVLKFAADAVPEAGIEAGVELIAGFLGLQTGDLTIEASAHFLSKS